MGAQVQVFADAAALSEAAALLFVREAQTAVSTHNRFLVALSGGTTPAAMFRLLATPPLVSQVPWHHTHLFWGDERLVPPDDPGSNYGQAYDLLLRHVPIPSDNIHRAKGELSPAAAVADYETRLAAVAENGRFFPRFDLTIMGLGNDGHTASLFPGPVRAEEQTGAVMAVTAVYEDRPAHRLTLTPRLFNDARHVLFLVAGKSKAGAVTAVLHGPHAPETWPAQRIQPTDGVVSWYLDQTVIGNQ